MDRITKNLLGQFSNEYQIQALTEDKRFEHFAAFSVVRRHYSRSLSTEDFVIGGGDDNGIDAIAIIVNNVLVTDADTVNELAEHNGFIDATFIFVQAERSSSFSGSKIGTFAFGVKDFFAENPKYERGPNIEATVDVSNAIISHAAKFRDNPRCFLYYVTTGQWQDDTKLLARLNAEKADLEDLQIFSNVDFLCFGASEIQKAYTQTKSPVSREFIFANRTDVAETAGVDQAFLGYVPVTEFLNIVSDDSGSEILGSIFYENVRDWQEYNFVNKGMRKTLLSDERSKFILMNNGVTIIAKDIKQANNKFIIEDFQIVNGCQTSNVIFDQRDHLDNSVCVPLRLIETRDESVIEAIIRATNSQTDVKPDQFFAMREFSKTLELYFAAFEETHILYFERRDGQYDRASVEKTRIITPQNCIRSFAAMYINEAHRTTRNYKALREQVGEEIFDIRHRPELYYAAAYAFYRLEFLFRAKVIPSEYKAARFHLLMAARYLLVPGNIGQFNSKAAATHAETLWRVFWDQAESEKLFQEAMSVVDAATRGNLDRDNVRTLSVTNAIKNSFHTP